MRTPSAGEYTKLKADFASHLDDLCNIIQVTRASGTYGTHSAQTRSMVSGVACDIWFPEDIVRNLKQGNVQTSPQLLIMDYDCLLYLPSTQSINVTDEVELVEKGNTLISGTFRPANPSTVNEIYQSVQLKRVVP